MHISQLFRPERLEEMIAEGFVSVQKHPTADLRILNYTSQTQYARVWNDVTLNCRGLIIDGDDNIVSRPFPKFFNLEEHAASEDFLARDFMAFEKMDGSLGVLYEADGAYAIATRGSFTSDQAVKGTEMLHRDCDGFYPAEGFTYLFEIIYPSNRIVVDYGDTEELVFLCAIHNETGANVFSFGDSSDWPGTHAKRYEVSCKPHELSSTQVLDNAEGYVLYFPSANFRVKSKFEEYVRLHRIVTGVSSKTIWRMLSNGEDINAILDHVPDEFYDWVKKTEADLRCKYMELYEWAHRSFGSIIERSFEGDYAVARQNRKAFAEQALKRKNNNLLFRLYDSKPLDADIWKMIQPVFERPYTVDLDA